MKVNCGLLGFINGQSSINGMHGSGLLPEICYYMLFYLEKLIGASSWQKESFPTPLIELEEQQSLNVLNKIHKPEDEIGQISTILNSIANDLFNNPDETTGIKKSFKNSRRCIRMTIHQNNEY